MFIEEKKIDELIKISHIAGKEILRIYNTKITKKIKKDRSPVTNADIAANKIICREVKKLYPEIPIISEESKKVDLRKRKTFWLIDPLDGTKEFLKRNGEFTVNIALINNKKPIFGIIYMPINSIIYFTKNKKSYSGKVKSNGIISKIKVIKTKKRKRNVMVVSRSHNLKKSEIKKKKAAFLNKFNSNKLIQSGSSIKFCLIASGIANIYPRYGTTMEWDTAAGDAILRNAGGKVVNLDRRTIKYGKKDFKNKSFIAKG